MRARVAALALLFAIPFSLAHAQRGGGMGGGMGGGRGGRGGGMGRGGGEPQALRFPSANDLGKFNPAELLADKKKNLSLADDQVKAMKALENAINERNAGFLARYDSVQRKYKPEALPGPYGLDEDTQDKIKQMKTMLDSLQVRRLIDVTESMSLVTDEKSRRLAAEFLVKQDNEYRAKLPQERMGFGGRGGMER